ncbi:hypothetical protein MKEN_00208900 [Mycena kentingensis (nom. inval.)]|nr:hypothetical protein MKEN_00208900 [Mycena kentingensis (nom. inval.)]
MSVLKLPSEVFGQLIRFYSDSFPLTSESSSSLSSTSFAARLARFFTQVFGACGSCFGLTGFDHPGLRLGCAFFAAAASTSHNLKSASYLLRFRCRCFIKLALFLCRRSCRLFEGFLVDEGDETGVAFSSLAKTSARALATGREKEMSGMPGSRGYGAAAVSVGHMVTLDSDQPWQDLGTRH